jgi:hypothetical protein
MSTMVGPLYCKIDSFFLIFSVGLFTGRRSWDMASKSSCSRETCSGKRREVGKILGGF